MTGRRLGTNNNNQQNHTFNRDRGRVIGGRMEVVPLDEASCIQGPVGHSCRKGNNPLFSPSAHVPYHPVEGSEPRRNIEPRGDLISTKDHTPLRLYVGWVWYLQSLLQEGSLFPNPPPPPVSACGSISSGAMSISGKVATVHSGGYSPAQ